MSLADSTDLRIILNVMYTMVETLRSEQDNDPDEWKKIREHFRRELSEFCKYFIIKEAFAELFKHVTP